MKVATLTEYLKAALTAADRARARRHTLPVSENFWLRSDGARLAVTGTDLEQAITVWVGAQVEGEGFNLTLPGTLLRDLVRKLPKGKVTLEQTGRAACQITAGSVSTVLNGTAGEEFPPVPKIKGAEPFHVNAADFRAALRRVRPAVASEDSRPVLTGVLLDCVEAGTVTMCAADGFRLAVDQVPLTPAMPGPRDSAQDVKFILPGRTVDTLLALLSRFDGKVAVTLSEAKTQARFSFDDVEVVTQLIPGTFPDYRKLIPEPTGTAVAFERDEFKDAVAAVAPYAREGSGIVRLTTPSEGLTVSARAEEMGTFETVVPALAEGEAKIAFNWKFLDELAAVLPEGPVVLRVTNPSSPGLFWSPGAPAYQQVIMPMFVQW
jgi:DNA polymerase-3 subunit beta